MVDGAAEKAREIGVSENVAILDDGGNLKAFSRMDYDSWIASVTPPVTTGQENFPTHLAQESTHQSLRSSAALDCVACH